MMSNSKFFERFIRLGLRHRNSTSPFAFPANHFGNQGTKNLHSSVTTVLRKVKDTVLVIEATKGPLVKTTFGIAQGVATAALVVGVGSGATTLATFIDRRSVEGSDNSLNSSKNNELSRAASNRIGLTYFHVFSSLLVSSFAAVLSFRIFRNKTFLMKMSDRPLVTTGVGLITPFIMASIVHKLPATVPTDGVLIPFGIREFGQLVYAGTLGLVAAPLFLLGGQSIVRAGFVASGLCAGLHGVAYLAPEDMFLKWGHPVGFAMHVVLASFILTMLLRRDHPAYKTLYRIMMHGGLVVYSAHQLYTTQAIRQAAKAPHYDPVSGSMALTMDMMNLYARLAFLLPPHFQLSKDHLIILPRRSPFNSNDSKTES